MQELVLRGCEFESRKEIHNFLKENLNFPKYYGGNLSALYDVLTDICEDTKVILELEGVEDDQMLDYYEKIVEVMSDASQANMYFEFEYHEV